MAKRNYIIYCDESDKAGRFCGNFFGGAVVAAEDRQAIDKALNDKKAELNFGNELKWQKVTDNYLDKYFEFVNFLFDFIESGRIKIRVMFTQNTHRPVGLTKEQIEESYFRLYYQFIKHAFGIAYCNPQGIDRVNFAFFFDQIPDSKEKCDAFKNYVAGIPHTMGAIGATIRFPKDEMAEVDSRDHVILQGLDLVLGAMCFRLNNKHLEKPAGARRRGRRTIAKERLYKVINSRIRDIYPNFNIGTSTGQLNGLSDRWDHQYRHWRFVPTNHELRPELGKRWTPPEPT